MFDFFKKKPKKEAAVFEKKELTEAEKANCQQQISAKEMEIETLLKKDCQEKRILAKVYEELGLLQAQLDTEISIITLEKSFSYQPSIGEGYKILMNLYNQKRSEAAYSGDVDEINKWLEKMDELRQVARNNTMRG